MPHLPVIGNTYRVTLDWLSPTGAGPRNVLHVQAVGASPGSVRTTLEDAFTNDMWALVSDNLTITQMSILPLDGTTPTVEEAVTSTHATGGRGGEWIPAYASVVSLHTALRGPANRGRIFLPWVPEGGISDGVLNETDRAAQAAAWATYIEDIATAANPCTLVVASYKNAVAHDVVNVSVSPRPGIIRNRQRHAA